MRDIRVGDYVIYRECITIDDGQFTRGNMYRVSKVDDGQFTRGNMYRVSKVIKETNYNNVTYISRINVERDDSGQFKGWNADFFELIENVSELEKLLYK